MLQVKIWIQIFEKVLVQNIQFGLSPSLTDALHSVPRWRFVVAAFPHVMQCAASMLQYRLNILSLFLQAYSNTFLTRKESIYNIGSSESKLLYTLHWILLDAMEECCLEDAEKGIKNHQDFNFPISSITVSCNNVDIQLLFI